MPLDELVRYFNATLGSGDSSLYDEGGRIAAWHDGGDDRAAAPGPGDLAAIGDRNWFAI